MFATFALLVIASVPIAISLGMATLLTIISTGTLSVDFLVSTLITSVDSFPIMAVPFFILAGDIMGSGGISQRLVNFANPLVKNITGGFAIASIITYVLRCYLGLWPSYGSSGWRHHDSSDDQVRLRQGLCNRGCHSRCDWCHDSTKYPNGDVRRICRRINWRDLFIAGIIPGILVSLLCLMAWAYIYQRRKATKDQTNRLAGKRCGLNLNTLNFLRCLSR
ncbi:TRAP transporter large permease subunit [Vibrio lentus]|nr:TRAP transporter large permease subunit [Vibrio lentus]